MGVWIETDDMSEDVNPYRVTPFVGVWIETNRHGHHRNRNGCHTLRGCVD